MQDLTTDKQSLYLKRVECLLKKECSLRISESIIAISDIAALVTGENDSDIPAYNGFPPEIRFEYIQRDKYVLERIQEDDDLRQYIGKVFQKKAEEIFDYTILE